MRLVEETPQDRDSDVTLIEEPEVTGLRRSKREHKLTNMWWSVKNNDVRVRFGIMDIKHAKRELVQKKNTTFHNKPKVYRLIKCIY